MPPGSVECAQDSARGSAPLRRLCWRRLAVVRREARAWRARSGLLACMLAPDPPRRSCGRSAIRSRGKGVASPRAHAPQKARASAAPASQLGALLWLAPCQRPRPKCYAAPRRRGGRRGRPAASASGPRSRRWRASAALRMASTSLESMGPQRDVSETLWPGGPNAAPHGPPRHATRATPSAASTLVPDVSP